MPRGPAGLSVLRSGLAVLVSVALCFAQPSSQNSTIGASSICSVPAKEPFGPSSIPTPEPVCLPSDAPPPSDEFLSFEEWKSLKLDESTAPAPSSDRVTNSNARPHDAPTAESLTDLATSPTVDGTAAPLPSLRVPLTDRFNYASSECSARIQGASKSIKSPFSILNSKRDKYMLSPCSTKDRFVVIELCDDIQIDTIQLANFEFFSGVFKDISISGAQTYDAARWHFLATFRGKNVRTVQSFLLPRDARFFRYVRIDFLSHYGSEYYCPVSLVRVYGLTQIEEYKWDEWQAAWHRDHEAEAQKIILNNADVVEPGWVTASIETVEGTVATPSSMTQTSLVVSKEEPNVTKTSETGSTSQSGEEVTSEPVGEQLERCSSASSPVSPTAPIPTTRYDIDAIIDQIMNYTPPPSTTPTSSGTHSSSATVSSDSSSSARPERTPPSTNTLPLSSSSIIVTSAVDVPTTSSSSPPNSSSAGSHSSPPLNETSTPLNSTSKQPSSSSSSHSPSSSSPSSSTRSTVVTVSTQPRASPSPPAGSSAGSESIYRNIMNRLTVLESNSSLSVRYMEEQTRYIRDAIKRLEQDVGRLENLSNQQQALYRRTAIELKQHKQEVETERTALLSQLENLSEEVLLEKRLGLAQLILLLIVLVFMAFTRSATLTGPLHESLSASSDLFGRVSRKPGSWRFRRTTSQPDPPKLPSQLLPRSSPSPQTNPSPAQNLPRTPAPHAGPSTIIDPPSQPRPLATPFQLQDTSNLPSASARRNHPLERLAQRPQSLSHPTLTAGTPADPRSPFPPPSTGARRTLAKTSHLHEVGRKRRVSGPSKRQPTQPSSPSTSGVAPRRTSPHAAMSMDDSDLEAHAVGRDVFGEVQTPILQPHVHSHGSPRPIRNLMAGTRPRSRGRPSLRAHGHTGSGGPSSPRLLQPDPLRSSRRTHVMQSTTLGGGADDPGTASGSDLWEDASDADLEISELYAPRPLTPPTSHIGPREAESVSAKEPSRVKYHPGFAMQHLKIGDYDADEDEATPTGVQPTQREPSSHSSPHEWSRQSSLERTPAPDSVASPEVP